MTWVDGTLTPVFHITHVDNLASIAEHGIHCDNLVAGVAVARSIGYPGIKKQRAETFVPVGPGRTVADYVPFYFAPRSPMLFTISRNNVAGAEGTHLEIVHLFFAAEKLAENHEFVFTNGHAIMELSDFFNDLAHLPTLDWPSIDSLQWGLNTDPSGETKRKKQSEFLVLGSVPWSAVRGIGVATEACRARASAALAHVEYRPQIVVRRDWYY